MAKNEAQKRAAEQAKADRRAQAERRRASVKSERTQARLSAANRSNRRGVPRPKQSGNQNGNSS